MIKKFIRWAFMVSLFLTVSSVQSQTISSEDALHDLNQLKKWVDEVHYNPSFICGKEAYENTFKIAANKFASGGEMTTEQYAMNLMQILSVMHDGHTTIDLVSPSLLPGMLDNDFFNENIKMGEHPEIVLCSSKDSGKVITSINDVEYITLYYESLATIGGNQSFKQELVESIFFPFYLHLKGIRSPYKLEFADGSQTTIQHGVDIREAIKKDEMSYPDYSFEILKNEVGVIYYNSCNDARKFDEFLKKTFKQIEEQNIQKLVIDIRKNTGGNSGLNDMLLRYVTRTPYRQSASRYWKVSDTFKGLIVNDIYVNNLGKKFVGQYVEAESGTLLKEDDYQLTKPKKPKYFYEGEKCLLIGPKTFSSANFLADAVATYKLMPIIGKPTGENTNDFGEQIALKLPKSELVLNVSIAYDIGADGDQNRIEAVDPDMYSEGDALEFALKWFSTL